MQTISAVPESITRAAYSALVAATGIDPQEVRLLEFRKDGIYAEVFARHPATGQRLIDDNGAIVNKVWIPVGD